MWVSGYWLTGKSGLAVRKVHRHRHTQHAKCNHKHDNEGGNKLQSTNTNTSTTTTTMGDKKKKKYTRTHTGGGSQTDKWYVCCELFLVPRKTSAKHRLKVLQMGLVWAHHGLVGFASSSPPDSWTPPSPASYLCAYTFVVRVCAVSLWSETATDAEHKLAMRSESQSKELRKEEGN